MAGNVFDQFDAPADTGSAPAPTGNVFDQFDTPAPDETVGRVAGLTGRALAKGVGDVEDLPRHLGAAADNVAINLLQRAGLLSKDFKLPDPDSVGYPSATSSATKLSDAAGLPTPATRGERIGSAAVEALPSTILSPGAPIVGAASAALGGAASQTVAENGGSPLQQTLAGLAGGTVPLAGSAAAGLTRLAARGGSAGQAAMQGRIADAAANGVNLTAGQATGSRGLQALESASSRLWGGGPISHAAEVQNAAIGSRVSDIVNNLSQGADVSPTAAGETINKGVVATKSSMRQAEKAAYDAVDQHVPATTGVDISGTLGKLDEFASPTPGATATSSSLVPPKIAALRENLRADVQANGGSALPYAAVRKLRTAIGGQIDWGFAPSDPAANGQLKQLYGTLGDDLNNAASAVGPKAAQAVKDASALYAGNQTKRELLDGIVNKAGGPEAVYAAATNGTKQGATKIGGIMSALDPQSQNTVRATVLDRLGRALPGQQNAAGNAFDASRLLTNWSALAPEAKDALFGASGSNNGLRRGLDSLTNTIETLRKSNALKNPSGTASAAGHSLGLWALLSEGAHSVMSGPEAIASGASVVAGNAVLSRALVNPRTVTWLASSTKLPPSALPGAVNALAKSGENANDPDAQDLAALLRARGIGRQ